MKKLLLLCVIFFGMNFAYAQNKNAEEREQFSLNLKEGEVFSWQDYSLEFVEVLEDSRCPKEVTCVRAGEAKLRFVLKKGVEKLDEQTLIITNPENGGTKLKWGDFLVNVANLKPYPSLAMKRGEKEFTYSVGLMGSYLVQD